MATYFDGSEAHDRSLIHADVRDHAELERVADAVELDVVSYFTREGFPRPAAPTGATTLYSYTENGVRYVVDLYGYDATLERAAGYNAKRSQWSGFAQAFRETIARVTSHRLRHYDADHGIESESIGRRSWNYAGSRDLRWPKNWTSLLIRYSTKPPVYGI